MCRAIPWAVGIGCLLRPVCSQQNSFPCYNLYSKAKRACVSMCFFTSYFCIPIPYDEKDIFWEVVLEGLVGFIELFNFSFFGISVGT